MILSSLLNYAPPVNCASCPYFRYLYTLEGIAGGSGYCEEGLGARVVAVATREPPVWCPIHLFIKGVDDIIDKVNAE